MTKICKKCGKEFFGHADYLIYDYDFCDECNQKMSSVAEGFRDKQMAEAYMEDRCKHYEEECRYLLNIIAELQKKLEKMK